MPPYRIEVYRRIEHADTRLIELDARQQETLLLAPENHAHVDELLPLDTRYDADHRVVIRAWSVHVSPPREMRAATEVAASGAGHNPHAPALPSRTPGRSRAMHPERARPPPG